MRATASMEGLGGALKYEMGRLEKGTTAGMREVTGGLTGELRGQVIDAALGQRLANTWRGITYPKSGASLGAASFVYSKAPKIVSLFASGATIKPHSGARYLWIPTESVPRGKTGKISPEEVVQRFGPFSFRPGRRGSVLAFVARRSGRGRGRERGIHMFTLRRFVQGPLLLDLKGPAVRWGDKAPAAIERQIEAQK